LIKFFGRQSGQAKNSQWILSVDVKTLTVTQWVMVTEVSQSAPSAAMVQRFYRLM